MPAFIKGKHFNKLKEAIAHGDERAKAILLAQMEDRGQDEIDGLLDDYFGAEVEVTGVPDVQEATEIAQNFTSTGNPRLDRFLKDNGICDGCDEYNDYVEDFYAMYPDKDHPIKEMVEEIKEEEPHDETPCECKKVEDKKNEILAEEAVKDDECPAIMDAPIEGGDLDTIGSVGIAGDILPEPEPTLDINGIIKNLIADELEAIDGYNNAIKVALTTCDDDLVRNTLEAINNEEKRHCEMLKKLVK